MVLALYLTNQSPNIGEMPHWVKKFVNAMENSSLPKSKRNMEYRGSKINLGMIEKVWRGELGGINLLRQSKLTDEHFNKNAHSRMRVHLAVQVLSLSVLSMLQNYVGTNNEHKKEYESLLLVVEKLNTLVDIWNHPLDKCFKCETNGERYGPIGKIAGSDIQQHLYIKYLEDILELFTVWRTESKIKKDHTLFMPHTLYESFCWIVYGLKGVASQIPDGAYMIQCRGGTDDVEQEFARLRQANSNSTLADTRGMIARGTGVRASDFAKNAKNNTGNKNVYYKELLKTKMKKYNSNFKR